MIPLLSNAGLLVESKLLMIIKSEGHMTVATGILPHICQAVLIKSTLGVCKDTLQAIKDLSDGVKTAVKQGFEGQVGECGQMTGEGMKIMINDYHEKVETLINTKLTELTNSFPLHPNRNDQASNENDDNNGIIFAEEGKEELVIVSSNQTIRYMLYAYDRRFWHVPKDFEFPLGVQHLDTGWKLWICGLPSNKNIDANDIRVQAPIRPFCILKPTMLPPDACKKFQLN